jgi:predicted aspartyl protease
MGRWGKKVFAGFLVALLAATAFPALAQDRCSAEPAATLPLVLLNGKILVGVLVNDQPALFAIDTGGFASAVSESLAARLKLPTYGIRSYQTLSDLGGERAEKYARISSLVIGNQQVADERYMVADLGPGVDGFIAPDLLRNFDLDFDFAAQRLNLYRLRSCAGKPPGSGAFSAVEMDVTPQGHIRVPVMLDGKRLWAMVDTGASRTYIIASAARANFSVSMGPGVDTAQGASGGTAKIEPHDFQTLQIGEDVQRNPRLQLIARDEGFDKAPVLLGMQQIHGLRLFVAYRERKLYVSRPGS